MKTQYHQAPEETNSFLQPCSAFPGTHIVPKGPVPGNTVAMPVSSLSPTAPDRTAVPACCLLLAVSGLWKGAVSSPGSAHHAQALKDSAHRGGNGQPWDPPGALLPDAKD